MKVFKCDGKRYHDGIQCQNETESIDEKGYPSRWITINGAIINNNRNHHTIQAHGEHHFCSWECLNLFLFKNVSNTDQE